MFERFNTRSTELERIDTGDYTTREYRKWQREMRPIHGIFGEVRALEATLKPAILSCRKRVSVLDVGAGSGELLGRVADWDVRGYDLLAGVEISDASAAAISSNGGVPIVADGLRLPFASDAFDFTFCTLLLHHLDDEPAIDLLREMGRVAKRRIFVVDLNRHPAAYYTFKILGRIFFQAFTRDDGALSILRSRTPDELEKLATEAGLDEIRVDHSRVNRLVLSGKGGRNGRAV